VELEPVDGGGEIVAAGTDPVQPELNDPMWKDVAKEVATRQGEKVPVIGTALRVREHRKQERRLRLIEVALQKLNFTVEEWDARLQDNGDLAELLGRAWDIVAEARSNEKVRLLANVVAAVTAGERLDVQVGHVILGVIAELEPLHFQTLVHVDTEAQTPPPMDDGGKEGVWGARRDVLEQLSGIDPEVLGIALGDLEGKRLIQNAYDKTYGGMEGKEAFVLTTLGDEVRKLLLEVGDEQPIPPK
jgi:hypothetical protein